MKKNKKSEGRRTRKISRNLGIGLLILVISSMVVLGAVLYFNWNYTATQSGDVTLTGLPDSDGTHVLVDGTEIFDGTSSIPLDTATLNPGDALTYPHTIESTNYYFSAKAELNLPDNSDPGHNFYGIDVDLDGANSQTFILEPGVQQTWNTNYAVSDTFIDPGIPFPFELIVTVWNDVPTIADFSIDVPADPQWNLYDPVWVDTEMPYTDDTLMIESIVPIDFDNTDNDIKCDDDYNIKCRQGGINNDGKTVTLNMVDEQGEIFSCVVTVNYI